MRADAPSAPSRARTVVVRADLAAAIDAAWRAIGERGSWWSGGERAAIAQETRQATACRLCAQRAAALSPLAATGTHDAVSSLPAPAIEAIHRIATDSGRLGRTWFDRLRGAGLGDGQYVEIVAIVAVSSASIRRE